MQQNTFRLIKLINNLIDSTKIDSESIDIHPINADIISFIEDTCSSVLHFIKSKHMNLVFDTDVEEEIINKHIDKMDFDAIIKKNSVKSAKKLDIRCLVPERWELAIRRRPAQSLRFCLTVIRCL